MTDLDEAASADFEALRILGREQSDAGELERALETYQRALELARRRGDRDQLDLAICNRAAILVNLDQGAQAVAELRRVLMSSPSHLNRHLAAYNISIHYDLRQERTKELFYARIALDYASKVGEAELIARSHNLVGNALVAQSYFNEAREAYAQALRNLPRELELHRALMVDNLAYCDIVGEAFSEAFSGLFESLRTLRRLGAREWQSVVHMDLSYAYLEIDRFAQARRHARRAFDLVEGEHDLKRIKNCLYLLGESAKHSGELSDARSCFQRLRDEFYPDNPFLVEMLMDTDVRKMINLRA